MIEISPPGRPAEVRRAAPAGAGAGLDPERESLRERFAAVAAGKLRDLRLEDLLSFLSARRVAPGAQSERFKHGFARPDGKTDAHGRERLLAYLAERATTFTPPTAPSDVVLGLVKRDAPAWREAWRHFAASHLTRASGEADERDSAAADETIRYLLLAAAASCDGPGHEHRRKGAGLEREPLPHDDPATALRKYADQRDAATADAYDAILAASGRRPTAAVGGTLELAVIVNALIDGLSARAIYDRDPERLRRLLAETVIPITAALTRRESEPEDGEERMILGDVAPPATRAYGRSPAAPVALEGADLDALTGTWQGTMFTDLAVKNDMRSGPCETYLSVMATPDGLSVTSFVEGGLSRMIAPAFFDSGGRRRMVCAYEAELNSNPTPERPAHRGAWVLETTADGEHMTAAYFNDRHRRGLFYFERRHATPATSFPEAKALFDERPWSLDVDAARQRDALLSEHGTAIDLPGARAGDR